jgi:WD40 repeat protein
MQEEEEEEEADLMSRLLYRGLLHVVEDILYFTFSASTLAACLQVSRFWHRQLTANNVWRRLFVRTFRRQRDFRLLCAHNGWVHLLPAGGENAREPAATEAAYRQIAYKTTWVREMGRRRRRRNTGLAAAKLYTGHLIACLKVFKGLLFAGMMDGQIKMWPLRDPVRNEKAFRVLRGHEERVTALEAVEDSLISASVDRSIRVWSISTGGMVRLLRGIGEPLLQIKLTACNRLISLSTAGRLDFWRWRGPLNIQLMHNISLEPGDLFACADVILDDEYIAVSRHNSELLALYSSMNGRRW